MAVVGVRVFRANLGAKDLKQRNPSWDDVMVNDYLGISLSSQEIIDQINENTVNISILQDDVSDNAAEIAKNQNLITSNMSLIYKVKSSLGGELKKTQDKAKDLEQLIVSW